MNLLVLNLFCQERIGIYKKLDDIIFSDRPEKARITEGHPLDLRKFVRTNAEGILETPIIEYENRDGKKITFVGAVHMGEKEYFAKLQEVLDSHGKVFFEGVGAKTPA